MAYDEDKAAGTKHAVQSTASKHYGLARGEASGRKYAVQKATSASSMATEKPAGSWEWTGSKWKRLALLRLFGLQDV